MPATATTNSGLKVMAPRKDLFEGLQMVGKAVATRSSLPILTHILLRQDEETGRVVITATDTELWISHTLPRSEQPMSALGIGGAATAPARNLSDLLNAMPEAAVELTGEGKDSGPHSLHLRCNRANYKLLGLPPDEYPEVPLVKEETRFTVSRAALRNAIRQTIIAVSADDSRAILTGVLLVYKDNILRCVATDTHRLAVCECPVINGTEASAQAVAPARAMHEVIRMMGSSEEGDITITLGGNQVQFRVEDEKTGAGTTLISRLIEGQFPNYERVVPQTHERRLTLECEPLLAALRRASIVAREQGSMNRIVIRTVDDDDAERLTITSVSGNLGEGFEEVEVARSGSPGMVEIAFNVRYLIDVLSVLDSPGIHLELTEPLRPGVVRPTEDPSYFCVLMPMQVV